MNNEHNTEERLKMKTADKVDENVKKIGELFPECLVEAKNSVGGGVRLSDRF